MNIWKLKFKKLHNTFHNFSRENEMLNINLIKHVQDLYPENFKMLTEEIKSKINGKTYCAHGLKDST